MKKNFFYGWVIVLLCAMGIGCSFYVLISSTMGFLVAPLGKEFGWLPQEIFSANIFATLGTVISAPFIGALVWRVGARKVIAVSFVLEALIIASFYYIDGSLWAFYVRYAVLAILAAGATPISFTTIISSWFNRKRGIALGITLAGTGIGGALWSLAGAHMFTTIGWRLTFVYFALFLIVIVMPLMSALIRNTPAEMGLNADGDATTTAVVTRDRQGITLRRATRTREYWLLAVVAFLLGFGVQSMAFNLVPMLKANGDSGQVAGMIQASMWIALVGGRLSTGWLLDRVFAPFVAIGFVIPSVIAALMFSAGITGWPAFAAALLVGLAAGAEVDVISYMTSRYFGVKHYSMIYGTFFSIFAVGSGVGPALTAAIAHSSGSYSSALYLICALLVVSIVLLTRFRRLSDMPSFEDETVKSPAVRISAAR